MRSMDYSAFKGLKAGAIGGLVGAGVLGLLAGLSAFVRDQEVFYGTIATKLGLSSPALTGWALHFLVGLLAGGGVLQFTARLQGVGRVITGKDFLVGLVRGVTR